MSIDNKAKKYLIKGKTFFYLFFLSDCLISDFSNLKNRSKLSISIIILESFDLKICLSSNVIIVHFFYLLTLLSFSIIKLFLSIWTMAIFILFINLILL